MSSSEMNTRSSTNQNDQNDNHGAADINIKIWESYYSNLTESYLIPNEYVVRSFLGKYPNLQIDRELNNKNVCDVSCGDGRNLVALNKFGLNLFATEVSDSICEITKTKLMESSDRVIVDIRTGSNESIPFNDETFDYLLSWNACYYMENEDSQFGNHVAEFARVMKSGSLLVCSVPSPGCFSLQGAQQINQDLIRINTDSKWDMLNGSIYRIFSDFEDVEKSFGTHFQNFHKCTIRDDCYGLPLEYFVFVCEKR